MFNVDIKSNNAFKYPNLPKSVQNIVLILKNNFNETKDT
jgi:hypothetical protein